MLTIEEDRNSAAAAVDDDTMAAAKATVSNRLFVAKLNALFSERRDDGFLSIREDLFKHFSKFGTVQQVLLSGRRGRNCRKATEHRNVDADADAIITTETEGNDTAASAVAPVAADANAESVRIPPFAFVEMASSEDAKRAVDSFHQRHSSQRKDLFGYLSYATNKAVQDMKQSSALKQNRIRQKVAAVIRQERLHVVRSWMNATTTTTTKVQGRRIVLEVHRSHEERLKEWLSSALLLHDDNESKLCCSVTNSPIPISKSASLLLLNTNLPDPAPLLQRIQSAWYIAPNVRRATVMDVCDSTSVVQGSLRNDVAGAIFDKVKRNGYSLDSQDGAQNSSRVVVRIHMSPTKLQLPLLKFLWQHLDTALVVVDNDLSARNIDFSHENATHSMSVIQVFDGAEESDEGDGLYLIGRLEPIDVPQEPRTTQSADKKYWEMAPSVEVDKDRCDVDHDEWRIALYYVYIDLPAPKLQENIDFHRQLCQSLRLNGRVRVSHEGVNGVLSGKLQDLQKYEQRFDRLLKSLRSQDADKDPSHCNVESESYPNQLDMKYCSLRKDLSAQAQLFDRLVVKETKTVINLFDGLAGCSDTMSTEKKQANRYRRRRERKAAESDIGNKHVGDDIDLPSLRQAVMQEPLQPSTHLCAADWNKKLDGMQSMEDALMIDVRNVYESRVGHFEHPTTPTLLTNTRKYSDLISLLASNPQLKEAKRRQVFMYCTGGVRCERVSMLVNQLYPEKEIYQLEGGIQNYLRDCNERHEQSAGEGGRQYFVGKNFVFDPRRTDPVHFGEVVGKCLVCGALHDDYDNGHPPSDNREARCNKCRMLVLVCNGCRPKWRCHGEDDGGCPLLYCNIDHCVHEGAAPEPTLVYGTMKTDSTADMKARHKDDDDDDNTICRAYKKLQEAWERYSFGAPAKQRSNLTSSTVAIDCGAAPGGWSQFLLKEVQCHRVYAVDPGKLSETLLQENERLRYMPMKIQDALPLIQRELGEAAISTSPPVSIWVCDMNCRDLSFPIDCLINARQVGLIGPGTFFVLTVKLVKGHAVTTFEMLVEEQVQRLLNEEAGFGFEKVHVLHLFSNRIRERTVMGYCS